MFIVYCMLYIMISTGDITIVKIHIGPAPHKTESLLEL